MQGSLKLLTFTNERLEMDPDEVVAVEIDGERVWVRTRDPQHYSLIEAKNTEDVTAWGRDSDKLKEDEWVI